MLDMSCKIKFLMYEAIQAYLILYDTHVDSRLRDGIHVTE